MLNDKQLNTKYAPAERLSNEEVKDQLEIFKNNEILNKFLSGTIIFSTSKEKGTTFMACYPLKKK